MRKYMYTNNNTIQNKKQIVQYNNNNNSKLHICDHVWGNPKMTAEFVIKF